MLQISPDNLSKLSKHVIYNRQLSQVKSASSDRQISTDARIFSADVIVKSLDEQIFRPPSEQSTCQAR